MAWWDSVPLVPNNPTSSLNRVTDLRTKLRVMLVHHRDHGSGHVLPIDKPLHNLIPLNHWREIPYSRFVPKSITIRHRADCGP